MATIAVSGSGGLVGSAVVTALGTHGATVLPLPGVRPKLAPTSDLAAAVASWRRDNPELWPRLRRHLDGVDTVVHAGGLHAPGSTDVAGLWNADTLLPAVLAAIAADAGVPRFVHVSDAAVQGRRDPLDETPAQSPTSPYTHAKAAAERHLLATYRDDLELAIYRAVEVLAPGDPATETLVRVLTASPRLAATGDRPLPVALVANVGAAAAHLATAGDLARSLPDGGDPIYLHPWEGASTANLPELLGGGSARALPVPRVLAGVALRGGQLVGSRVPRMDAALQRARRLLLGQGQDATALAASGFSPPVGLEGYRLLALRR